MSAKIFTVGYGGFNYATGSDRPGLLFWSGSFAMTGSGGPNETTNYTGLGFEIIRDTDNFLRFSTNPSQFEVRTQTFFLGGTNQFVSGSGGNIEISSSNFHLDNAGNVIMQGTITADAGNIGGFTITDEALASTNGNLVLSGSGQITASAGQIAGFILESNRIKSFGHIPYFSGQGIFLQAPADGVQSEQMYPAFRVQEDANDFTEMFFSASKYGVRSHVAGNPVFELGSTNQIAGWTFNTTTLTGGALELDKSGYIAADTSWKISSSTDATDPIGFISSSDFKVSADGRMTASAGLIADWTIGASGQGLFSTSSDGGVFLSGTSKQIIIQTGSEIGSDVIVIGQVGVNTFGIVGKDSGGNSIFKLGQEGNEIAGWNISNQAISKVTANGGVKIDSTNRRLEFRTGSAEASRTVIVGNLGGVNSIGSNKFGILGLDSTDNTKTLFKLGEDGNEIAGWTISDTQLRGGNLVLDKAGKVFSDGFVSSTMPMAGTGFMLSVDDGTGASYLEVENARIRGTLSTAVFEKETVSAVGGQLLVANSTTISSESVVTPSDTTMSVANASGFVADEIILAKKVDGTGFNTEYMKIESASIDDVDSGQGRIMVERGFGQGLGAGSGSNPAPIGTTQAYSGSQVLVSTGRLNTGFIHLNANPSDAKTPYIDIVERTGSGLYDAKLAARLGDLSGIEDTKFSDGVTGYGLYTQNGYFSGKIEVASLPQAPNADKLLAYYPLDTLNAIDASGLNTGSATSASAPTVVSHPAGFGLQATAANNIALPANNSNLTTALAQSSWTMCFYLTAKAQSTSYEDIIHWNLDTTNDDGGGTTATNKLARFEHTSDNDSTPGYNFLYHTQKADGTNLYPNVQFPNLEEGRTYHIAIVSDIENNLLLGYVDGVSSSAGDFTSGGVTITSTTAGTSGLSGPELFASNVSPEVVSELRFYTGSLSAAEIESIYLGNTQQGGGRTVIEGGQITTGRILSTNFDTSNGTEMDLDGEVIRIGGSNAATEGIVLDGSTIGQPKFFVGASSGEFVRFNHTADTLEISASNFSVDASGNVNMTGDLTVTGGQLTASIVDLPSDENLIAYYPLHTDVISANGHNRVLDYSGNDFHSDDVAAGVASGISFTSATFTTGPLPSVASFNGTVNGRIDLSSLAPGGLVTTTMTDSMDISLSFWIYKLSGGGDSGNGVKVAPFGFHDGGNNDLVLLLDKVSVSGNAQLIVGNTDMGTITGLDAWGGNWRHVVLTMANGGNPKLYVDGQLKGTFAQTANTSDFGDIDEIILGGELDGAGGEITDFFYGYMGEFRVYKTELTADNALALFNLPTGTGMPGGTKISGDKITTGAIRSNNWDTTAGSQLDLDAGTIKLGGSSAPAFAVNSLGEVTASAGKIANFVIDGHSLTTTGVEINDSTQDLFISSSKFKVDHTGNMTGSQVQFTGGDIGGFTIDDHSLSSTGVEINDSTQTYFLSSSAFKVKHSGEMTGSDVLFTGGKIASFTINASTITSTNFTLDASNSKISLGSGDNIVTLNKDDGIAIGSASFNEAPIRIEKEGKISTATLTERTIKITSSNKSAFFQSYNADGFGSNDSTDLHLDGALTNGLLTKNLFITSAPTYAIRKVTFPNSTGEVMNMCTLYISSSLAIPLDTNGLPSLFITSNDVRDSAL